MISRLYRLLTGLGAPLVALHLRRRRGRGKEHTTRHPERRGIPGRPRPQGPVVWIHAASVGESLSVLPLLSRLLETHPTWHALVTTGTVTSAELMAKRLPERAFHQFVPVDVPHWVRRFLDHWRPDLGLWMESEFWPNLLAETERRSIPLVLLNGRISERSFRAWKRWPSFIHALLRPFDLCLGQTEEDTARLRALGAEEAECLGNLKLAAPPLPVDEAQLESLKHALVGRSCWLAASTHAGEEALAWDVHREVVSRHPGLLTVVVPRHSTRGDAIRSELEAAGARVAQRSRGEVPDAQTDLYLADTMGELGLFYRLCKVVFVGKSLLGEGGQNPVEPARLGCVVLFGPNMQNFAEIAARMETLGAARTVAEAAGLAGGVGDLLADPTTCKAAAEAALAFATAEAEVLDRVAERLSPYFEHFPQQAAALDLPSLAVRTPGVPFHADESV